MFVIFIFFRRSAVNPGENLSDRLRFCFLWRFSYYVECRCDIRYYDFRSRLKLQTPAFGSPGRASIPQSSGVSTAFYRIIVAYVRQGMNVDRKRICNVYLRILK